METTQRNWTSANNIVEDCSRLPNYMLLAIGGSHGVVDTAAAATPSRTSKLIGLILQSTRYQSRRKRGRCSTTSQVTSADKKPLKLASKRTKPMATSATNSLKKMISWNRSNILQACMTPSSGRITTATSPASAVESTNKQMLSQ